MRIAPLALLFSLAPAALAAQAAGRFPPDTLRNLRVLPATMTPRDVVGVMRGFALSLGVRCQFCHVGQEGADLATFDFASDEKPTKETARAMLRMVQAINGQHLATIARRQQPPVEVTCNTCHRGASVPRVLGEVITAAAQAGGLDSAVRAYRNLRERFYGRATYDFGETALGPVAQGLAQGRRFDDALGILRLNLEFFPQSSQTHAGMGEVLLAKGDTTAAIAAFRQALTLNSSEQGVRQRLRALGQQP